MRRHRLHILVLVLYAFLALLATWPLLPGFTSHVPGDGGDDPALTWNLWWVKYALLDLHTSPFDCRYMFYPIGINLAFYTLTVLNAVISIPLQFTFGLIPAGNMVLLSSFTLSAFGAYLLTLNLLPSSSTYRQSDGEYNALGFPQTARYSGILAPFLSGIVYGFASCKLFYASLGQFNIASSQWIPFFVLFFMQIGRCPSRKRYVVMAALFLIMQAWAEMTFASFLLLFIALYAFWVLGTRPWREALSFLASTLMVLALFLIGISPMLAAMVPDLRAEGDFLMQGTGFAEVFSADPVGFLLPTRLHPLLGRIVDRFSFPHDKGQHLYPGYVVLSLAFISLQGWKRTPVGGWHLRLFFALGAFFFALLSLGPTLHLNSYDTGIPLPFAILQKLPFFKGNRYPGRYNVMVMLCLAPLAGDGFRKLLGRFRTSRPGSFILPASILFALAFEHLSIPLPLSDMRIPAVYRTIAADPQPGTVLEIPLAWRNGFRITGTMDEVIMFEQFYQTLHHRPILGGNTSRNPEFKFQYFTEAPVINSIIALENGRHLDEDAIARDEALAPYVIRFFNLRYLVIHQDRTPPELKRYLERVFGLTPESLVSPPGPSSLLVYRITPPPAPETLTLEMDSALAHLSRGEGWAPVPTSRYIWAQRRRVRLLVPLGEGVHRMRFKAFVPGEGQMLTVTLNGHRLPPLALKSGWGEYELALPAEALKEGLNEFILGFSRSFRVRSGVNGGGEVSFFPFNPGFALLVRSAGMDVGDFGRIYVNGVDVSPNGRGYNIVVLNPETGGVEARRCFDTFASEQEARAMAEFIVSVPKGRVVAVAVRDEASLHLTGEAVDALGFIGAVGDLRRCFRCSHSIIGIKGLPPGYALEALSPIRPVSVWVGEAISEPRVTAAFKSFEFSP